MKPKCKCGKVCQLYGKSIGNPNYSVSCKDCNTKNAARQRRARAIKKQGVRTASTQYPDLNNTQKIRMESQQKGLWGIYRRFMARFGL